jgi:hypothetical protein
MIAKKSIRIKIKVKQSSNRPVWPRDFQEV